jgi:DNA polymerase-3 subunit epsilon
MEFTAIDVETANADLASICQVGVALYRDSSIETEWMTYINPEDFFDPINVSIHGIDEQKVRNSPILPDIAEDLYLYLNNRIVVCHTHFDRVATQQSFIKYGLPLPDCIWLDSARVTRRAWEQFSRCGYGLSSICEYLGYTFQHHDALEDAKAAGFILIQAIKITGLDIDGWIKRVNKPIFMGEAGIACNGNPDGPLFGEVMAFTGSLEMPRREAAKMASQIGCTVATGVTKETTILVVGDQDAKKLAGHQRSAKHRKAEVLISTGQKIRIIRETDFIRLMHNHG